MKHSNIFLSRLILIVFCLLALPAIGISKEFKMFDATQYSRRPDLAAYGLQPMAVIYEQFYWKPGQSMKNLPPKEQVMALSKRIPAKGEYVTSDVEYWKLDDVSDLELAQNIERYKTIVKWTKEAYPGKKVGIFGRLPIWDNYRCNTDPSHPRFKQWQAANNKLRPLAEVVDCILPELYAVSPDMEAWRKVAVAQLEAARSYGKLPVFVYLWPEYWDLDKRGLEGKPIPAEFWRLQLETAYQYADGVVIWGGYGKNGPIPWNNEYAWWKVTKAFMQEKGLSKK